MVSSWDSVKDIDRLMHWTIFVNIKWISERWVLRVLSIPALRL